MIETYLSKAILNNQRKKSGIPSPKYLTRVCGQKSRIEPDARVGSGCVHSRVTLSFLIPTLHEFLACGSRTLAESSGPPRVPERGGTESSWRELTALVARGICQ